MDSLVGIRLTTGELLDLGDRPQIPVTYAIAKIGKIQQRTSDISPTFQIPDTPGNRGKLGFPDLTVEGTAPYKKINAYLTNGDTTITKGYLRIGSVKDNFIQCSFFSGNANWLDLLEGDLNDLDLRDLDHNYDGTDISARMNTTEGVIYPLIDYGTLEQKTGETGDRILVADMYPAVYVKTLLKRMFDEIGYKLAGSFVDSWPYQHMILPFSANKFVHSEDWVAQRSYIGVQESTVSYGTVNIEVIAQEIQSGGAVENGLINNPTQPSPGPSNPGTFYEIGNPPIIPSMAGNDFTVKVRVIVTNFVAGGSPMRLSIKSFTTVLASTSDIVANGTYDLSYTGSASAYMYAIFEQYAPYTGPNFSLDCTYAKLQVTPSADVIEGSAVSVADNVPTISKKELLQFLAVNHGLVMYADNYEGTLHMDFFNNIIDAEPEDWTEKVIEIQEVNFTEIVNDYGKKTWFKMNDSDDSKLKLYEQQEGNQLGSGFVEIDNDFLPSEEDIYEAPFAGSKQIASLTDTTSMPFIERSTNLTDFTETQNPTFRVLYVVPDVAVTEFSSLSSIFFEAPIGELTELPYCWFFKDRQFTELDTVIETLAFGAPNVPNPNDIDQLTSRYRFWGEILAQSKFVTVLMRIKDTDIVNLDFTTPKYLSYPGAEGKYYLNRIVEYISGEPDILVELIKIGHPDGN